MKFHPKVNLTIEVNHSRFLDTKTIKKVKVRTKVSNENVKLLVHWSSSHLKRYKQNPVIGDLHSSKKIYSK